MNYSLQNTAQGTSVCCADCKQEVVLLATHATENGDNDTLIDEVMHSHLMANLASAHDRACTARIGYGEPCEGRR